MAVADAAVSAETADIKIAATLKVVLLGASTTWHSVLDDLQLHIASR